MADHRKDYAFRADDPRVRAHDEPFYSGALSFCRRPYRRDLDGIDVGVMGVPLDTTVTNRPGTRFGPRAIRAASTNLAWARPWPHEVDPFEALAVADWGDVWFDPGHPEGVPAQIEAAIGAVLKTSRALVLGGDHFVSGPSLRAHAAKHGPLALIHFDAHSDTWPAEPGRIDHGTMFRSVAEAGVVDPAASIQIGLRTTNDDTMGFEVVDAIRVHEEGWRAAAEAARRRVGERPVYVTFDIDALDPAFAPGTGTPVTQGLTPHQALSMLRALKGLNVVGSDVVEVSPPYDHAEITALAGATVAVEMLCLFAAAPKGRP